MKNKILIRFHVNQLANQNRFNYIIKSIHQPLNAGMSKRCCFKTLNVVFLLITKRHSPIFTKPPDRHMNIVVASPSSSIFHAILAISLSNLQTP